MNDDTRGEIIAGSSGTPAASDNADCLIETVFGSAPGTVPQKPTTYLSYFDFHYSTKGGYQLTYPADCWNHNWALQRCRFYNIEVAAAHGDDSTIAGHTNVNDTWSNGWCQIDGCYVDSSCTVDNATGSSVFNMPASGNRDITNNYIDMPCVSTNGAEYGIYYKTKGSGKTVTFTNNYVSGKFQQAVYAFNTNGNMTYNVTNCTFDSASAYGLHIYLVSGGFGITVTANVKDCQANNIDGGSGVGYYGHAFNAWNTFTGILTNCGHYSCDTRSTGFGTDTDPINAGSSTDPVLANLPPGVLPHPGDAGQFQCLWADGICTTSASYLEQGSRTFTAAGLDADIYTPNGKRFALTDNVTPGAMYWVRQPQAFIWSNL